jgi:hypothetical protein
MLETAVILQNCGSLDFKNADSFCGCDVPTRESDNKADYILGLVKG